MAVPMGGGCDFEERAGACRWIGIYGCICRGCPFSLALKHINLGLGFQVH